MANDQNLKPWQPGQSGNPAGKPKGAKHVSTRIREMLNDDNFETQIWDRDNERYGTFKRAPLEYMIKAQVVKALNGDSKAFDALLKHGWGKLEPDPIERPGNPIYYIVNNVPISGGSDDEGNNDALRSEDRL